MEKTTLIKVTNRDMGSVGYIIPDLGNLNRQFQSGETKEIPFEELERLSWVPGGMYILKNLLVIHDEDAVKEILGDVEPEYYYSEANVKRILLYGTLDEFLDCLDFAPVGVLDMIKDLAVSMQLNDVQKRKAIEQKLDFDVDKAIELKELSKEEAPAPKTEKRRASAPTIKDEKPARRVIKTLDKE